MYVPCLCLLGKMIMAYYPSKSKAKAPEAKAVAAKRRKLAVAPQQPPAPAAPAAVAEQAHVAVVKVEVEVEVVPIVPAVPTVPAVSVTKPVTEPDTTPNPAYVFTLLVKAIVKDKGPRALTAVLNKLERKRFEQYIGQAMPETTTMLWDNLCRGKGNLKGFVEVVIEPFERANPDCDEPWVPIMTCDEMQALKALVPKCLKMHKEASAKDLIGRMHIAFNGIGRRGSFDSSDKLKDPHGHDLGSAYNPLARDTAQVLAGELHKVIRASQSVNLVRFVAAMRARVLNIAAKGRPTGLNRDGSMALKASLDTRVTMEYLFVHLKASGMMTSSPQQPMLMHQDLLTDGHHWMALIFMPVQTLLDAATAAKAANAALPLALSYAILMRIALCMEPAGIAIEESILFSAAGQVFCGTEKTWSNRLGEKGGISRMHGVSLHDVSQLTTQRPMTDFFDDLPIFDTEAFTEVDSLVGVAGGYMTSAGVLNDMVRGDSVEDRNSLIGVI